MNQVGKILPLTFNHLTFYQEKVRGGTFAETDALRVQATFGEHYRIHSDALPKITIKLKQQGFTGNTTVCSATIKLEDVESALDERRKAARKSRKVKKTAAEQLPWS